MPLLTRIYFNAVFGSLGGLLGWLLFCLFGNPHVSEEQLTWQLIQDGGLIGAGIGYFVVSVEAIRDRAWLRFVRLASYGAILGALGGAVGILLAEFVNYRLVGGIGAIRGSQLKFFATVLSRGLGFLFLGILVGLSEGIAFRSRAKMGYGAIGGALGGFLGGCLFGFIYLFSLERGGDAALAGATGLVLLGAFIAALSSLVRSVFQPARLRVLRGWQEGRDYPLDKPEVYLGRDEHADVALFRDMTVQRQHVRIERSKNGYVLHNLGAPPEFTRVNDIPVTQPCVLHDGDRLQVGKIVLRFEWKTSPTSADRGRSSRSVPVSTGKG